MTIATLLPYLLVVGGYLLRHFDVLAKLLSLVSIAGGSNPLAPAPSAPPRLPDCFANKHPVLSSAVNAAIQQAVRDVVAGHVVNLRDEIKAAIGAAVSAAVADLKPKSS